VSLVIGFANPNPFVPEGSKSRIAYKTLVDWGGFATIFTTASVALNFHFSAPEIICPMKSKTHVFAVTSSALGVAFGFYFAVGVMTSMYFGPHTLPLATLNWQNYTGMEGGWGGNLEARPWYALFVQLWVMLFPVFDMLSVFPLVAITLAENIHSFIPQAWTERTSNRFVTFVCRLSSSIPPILFAAGLNKLDLIFNFTGLFAFFLLIIFPALLQFASITYCQTSWDVGCITTWQTSYSGHFSHKGYALASIGFGVAALVFSFINVVAPKLFHNGTRPS